MVPTLYNTSMSYTQISSYCLVSFLEVESEAHFGCVLLLTDPWVCSIGRESVRFWASLAWQFNHS